MARTNNKEIILKEAFRLFLSKGYDAVSFADLVKATNISRGGMFHHFKGKEDIFNQVADRFVFNFFREGESFIESPKSATPLKDFLAHCTKIIGERMLHFSETLGASVTAASFMSFILYLKEHYASWQEKIQEYEEQEVKTWNEVIELAKKKREIREDIDNGQIITVFRTLVHGELGNFPMEIFSSAGVCLTSLQALKICYSNILAGLHQKAVCVASELTSPALVAKFYDPEYEATHANPDKDPYMAFEKDFMRFMLSDGAGAVLVEDTPKGDPSLEIEWIEMTSYANELPTCMFMASELQSDGRLKSWKEYTPEEIKERGVLVGKQDIRQLKVHIIKYWVDHIEAVLAKHNLKPEEIDYVIPHVSSMFFYEKLNDELSNRGIALTKEKWFTNLTSVGNIGSAAIYVALDELIKTKQIKRGAKILLLVPESGRFSYGTVLIEVCNNLLYK